MTLVAVFIAAVFYLEEEAHLPGEGTIRAAVMATVMLSIYAHGITALSGIRLYVSRLKSLGPTAPEHQN